MYYNYIIIFLILSPSFGSSNRRGVASTVAREIRRLAEPEASSGREISSSDVPEPVERAEDAVNAGGRVR